VTPRYELVMAEAQLHSFLISVLYGGECNASRPSRLTRGDSPRSGYPLDRNLGGTRAGLDTGQNINMSCTAGNQTAITLSFGPSLYYLSYLGCHICRPIRVCMYVCIVYIKSTDSIEAKVSKSDCCFSTR
jgi:hypothetical protein